MKVGLQVVIITLICRNSGAATVSELNSRLHLHNKTMDFPRAGKACQKLGSQWSLPDGQTHETLIANAMTQKNITSVWSKVVQKKLKSWKWMNNKAYSRFSDSESGGCGVLDIHSKMSENDADLSSHLCSDTGLGFICTVPERAPCDGLNFISSTDNFTYMVGCSFRNWFRASQYCQSCKGTLAIVGEGQKRRNLRSQLIKKKACENHYSLFFIGLHIEDWVTYNAEGAWVPVVYPKWLDGEPKDVNFQCTILQREMNRTGLKVLNCYQKRHVLCLKDVEKHESNIKHTTDQIATEDCSAQERTIFDLKVAVSAVLSLLLLLSLLAICLKRRCSKKLSNRTMRGGSSKSDGKETRNTVIEEKNSAYEPMLHAKPHHDKKLQEDPGSDPGSRDTQSGIEEE